MAISKRRVKRTNGGYTLEEYRRLDYQDRLCTDCGARGCSVREILQRLKTNRFGARVDVLACQAFVPTLDFRDPAGTLGRFNTFRLGTAWADRLQVNQAVALRSPKGLYGSAAVEAIYEGPFVEMDTQYGFDNHLAIAAAVEDKEFDLAAVMRDSYGPTVFKPDKTVTVIYLNRLDDGTCS